MHFLVADIKAARFMEQEADIAPQPLLGALPDFISFRHPLHVEVEAQLTQGEILISAEISTRLTLNCGRCLDNFEKEFDVAFDEIYGLDLEEIKLDDEIRENVLIDLPVKSVCRENCKGICPACGKNRNTTRCQCAPVQSDPRWDALKKFKI